MQQIYNTFNGSISQDDEKNCFILSFQGVEYQLSACSLIALKLKIDKFDLEEILLSDPCENSLEIIPLCNKERFLILGIDDIIELKELISGGFVMLELHSILHHRIVRISV